MSGYKELEEKLLSELKVNLKSYRFNHTMGVAKCAKELANIYGEDQEKSYFAGLFHDYAKEFSYKKIVSYIVKYNIEVDKYEKNSNELIHGKIASAICENEYKIEDKDILNAIKYHTTGRKNMTKLEKIICLADYIEENRRFDGVEKIRTLSKKNLDLALYHAFNVTLANLISKNVIIHPNTVKSRNHLLKILKKDKKKES